MIRKFASLIFGVFLVLLVLNIIAAYIVNTFPVNHALYATKTKWDRVHNLKQPVGWIILGDSSGGSAFNEELFKKVYPDESFLNLTTTAGSLLVNQVWMLEAYKRKFGYPKNIVLINSITTLDDGVTEFAFQNWVSNKNFLKANKMSSISVPVSGNEIIYINLQRYFPLFARSGSLGSLIKHPLRVIKSFNRINKDGNLNYLYSNPAEVIRDAQQTVIQYRKREYKISEINIKSLKFFSDIAQEEGVNVYIASAPMYTGLIQNKIFWKIFKEANRQLVGLFKESPAVYLGPEVMQVDYRANQMENADHIIRAASVDYTKKLITAIRSTNL